MGLGCVAMPGGRIYNAALALAACWCERRGAGAVDRGGLEMRRAPSRAVRRGVSFSDFQRFWGSRCFADVVVSRLIPARRVPIWVPIPAFP